MFFHRFHFCRRTIPVPLMNLRIESSIRVSKTQNAERKYIENVEKNMEKSPVASLLSLFHHF